jgi:CheY-like chemotaxis protein
MGDAGLTALDTCASPNLLRRDRRKVSVLVVDDDPDTCDLLGAVLVRAGYSVVTASNGREALAVLRSIRPEMILLDIQMPLMDGAEFRQAQRRSHDLIKIPTVVMTGSKEEPVLDLAVVETLTKPFRTKELLAIVGRHCDGRSSSA